MTTQEAITKLREMQSQIIHGSNIFGDIADIIQRLEAEDTRRIKHLNRLASWAQQDPTGPVHTDSIQEWVLNEIQQALGGEEKTTAWQPSCMEPRSVAEPLDDTVKKPRLFYYEDAQSCMCPAPDRVEHIISTDIFGYDGEKIEIEFQCVHMTDKEFANLPEV